MKIGGVYRIKYNVYDIYDTDSYVIKVLSKKSTVDNYYEAIVLDTGYKIHFYPKDWSIVHELSSLEIELL